MKPTFKTGDQVMLRPDVLRRYAQGIPAHAGFTTAQFAWRETLDELAGKTGVIERIFDSGFVNVNFDGQIIGIAGKEVVPVIPVSEFDLDIFTSSYIEAALWASSTEDGTPLDRDYGVEDLAPETLAAMREDCRRFLAMNPLPDFQSAQFTDAECAGHDFFLTRNHHGTGSWDRMELSQEDQDRLTAAAHAFGEVNLYVGDDGLIYQQRG